MSRPLSRETFLPCLLDRLCDDEPHKTRDTQYQHSLTMASYRSSVLRDLSWLLNTPSIEEEVALEDFPEVLRSVINYGTPDLCGRGASTLDPTELERQITECILRYEPRVMRKSLVVRFIPGVTQSSPHLIGFEIRGMMWANPMPEQFLLETKLDLETGQCDF